MTAYLNKLNLTLASGWHALSLFVFFPISTPNTKSNKMDAKCRFLGGQRYVLFSYPLKIVRVVQNCLLDLWPTYFLTYCMNRFAWPKTDLVFWTWCACTVTCSAVFCWSCCLQSRSPGNCDISQHPCRNTNACAACRIRKWRESPEENRLTGVLVPSPLTSQLMTTSLTSLLHHPLSIWAPCYGSSYLKR
jgi:hypothetical protein